MTRRFEKFLPVARAVASLSKDPEHKVGALALNDDGIVLAVGYNGFPRGVHDDEVRYLNREVKLRLISHAEANVVAQAAYAGHSLRGATVVVYDKYPCSACAKLLIQSGVKRVVTYPSSPDSSWYQDSELSRLMFKESGLEVFEVNI